MCDRTEVADELALYRGVIPHIIPYNYDDPKETADRSIKQLLARGYLTKGNTIVLITSMDAGDRLVDAVQMRHID
jgi:pyruvate kinase